MRRAAIVQQANTLRPRVRPPTTHARRARQTRTHLPGVVLSRIVSAMQGSPCPDPAHVSNARRASTKPTAGTGRARTAGQAHTPRQSQLLPTAHARHALPIQMRQPGVMLSRIAAAIPATPESMVANAQSAWQASIRMFLDLVPVVSAQAANTQRWRVPRRKKSAHLVHRIRLYYQVAMTRMTVCVRLDITKTQVHARNVGKESSKSRWAMRHAAIVQPARIPRRSVKRQVPRAFGARQVNTVRLRDGELIASCVLRANTQTNQEHQPRASARSVPQERHHQQAAMQWMTAPLIARQA